MGPMLAPWTLLSGMSTPWAIQIWNLFQDMNVPIVWWSDIYLSQVMYVQLPSYLAKVMFSSCPLLCLFVCLSVSNITGKRLNGFSWIFQDRWDLIQGTIGNIFRMFHLTPWTQEFFPTFSEESMTLSSIAEKRLNGFSWNFQERTDLTQGASWNTFGMLRLTPWILGRFIYFMDPCLFVISWKKGWMDFQEIFMKRQARHKKW